MNKCTLYEKLENNAVRCTACCKYCNIAPNETGICGVRKNEGGELKLLVYGKAAAVHVDPIEKKPLFHFLPNSKIFSIGTVGCNFGCSFCQNWDLSQVTKDLKKKLSQKRMLDDFATRVHDFGYELSPQAIVDYCLENNIPSIAYTYNEPSIFFEYTYDTARIAHKNGIKNVYVSNGYQSPEAIDIISPYLDGINIDLKSFRDGFYKKICKASLEPVLKNIKRYHEKGVWVELTTLLIPRKNDSENEIEDIAKYIYSISDSIPWHISRFHPAYKMNDLPSTSVELLKKAYEIGKSTGLKYVYAGNIYNQKLHSTYCPKCDSLLVERDWDYTKVLGIKGNCCGNCQNTISGVWNVNM